MYLVQSINCPRLWTNYSRQFDTLEITEEEVTLSRHEMYQGLEERKVCSFQVVLKEWTEPERKPFFLVP